MSHDQILTIGNHHTSPEEIYRCLKKGAELQLGKDAVDRIVRCREYLDNTLQKGGIHYGINTGFGHLCDVVIKDDQLEQLQENLLLSHACGTGDTIPDEISRVMLLLKIKNLSLGHSGVRLELVNRLSDFYNSGASPVVYEQGSLGASGDLAPLAHLCLPLIGAGKVNWKGKTVEAKDYLKENGWQPMKLASKEGLALINGTQFSSGYGICATVRAKLLLKLANLCAALSLEAFNCQTGPFNPLIHKIRPHEGQTQVALEVLSWLNESDINLRDKQHVQDPYSFRCIPQVHGACFDNINNVYDILNTEINSVSDNPLIFPEEDQILSGGNFHAQPVAFAMDHLALGLCELASISERRIYQLINGHRGLPVCLIMDAGINSGFMILQYSAASVVSLNKQLATPASVDTIISSIGQEDHVSMAANAATKTWKITKNTFNVLAMEFFTAMQAISLRPGIQLSPKVKDLHQEYRKRVSVLEQDRALSDDVEITKVFLEELFDQWLDEL
ncbi:MAG: histidine ammonia-lyase [Saprospirales bacterium]|nr:MAG: histidine ammonia-lyase [Saprospirales bacterium]